MKNYQVTVHFRYVSNRQIEKDHDTHYVSALSPEHAKVIVSEKYGTKYVPFKFEVHEQITMTKELLFNLTNPILNVNKIQKN